MGKGKRERAARKAKAAEGKTTKPTIRVESRLIELFSVKKGKRTYASNRAGLRQYDRDAGLTNGHTRKSPSKYKAHKPTAEELEAWAEWKAEQKEAL